MPLESRATASQAAGIRHGKGKTNSALCPAFLLGTTSFQSISIPFWLPRIFCHLVPDRGGKNKGRRPSTAGGVRCLLCHAPLFPLPEGVLTLKYSSQAVSSCLLLPER